MKKMNKAYCCDVCFEALAKRSTSAARLWVEICDVLYEESFLRVVSSGESKFDESLQILEEEKFLISMDTQDFVIIKSCNFDANEPKYPFCRGGHNDTKT
jgi:hypothetical protein